MPVNREILDAYFARGLCSGVQGPHDTVCILAAIAAACGEPINDVAKSACILPAARAHAIALNDKTWSNPQARSKGLYALANALPGTAELDQKKYIKKLAELTIRRILPPMLRKLGLKAEADLCEQEGTRESALQAKKAAVAADYADYADYAAAAAGVAAGVAAVAAAVAADYAAYAAYAVADYAADIVRDQYLVISAQCSIDALIFAAQP